MSSLRRKLVTVSYTSKGQLMAIPVVQLPVNAGVQESVHALKRGLWSSMLIINKITRKSTHRCARLTGLTGLTGHTGLT